MPVSGWPHPLLALPCDAARMGLRGQPRRCSEVFSCLLDLVLIKLLKGTPVCSSMPDCAYD